MMQFSQRLRELRKEQKLTQAQLATVLNYGYTAIANYESGRNEPCMSDFIKLVNVLNTNADYLLGNSDIKSAQENHLWQEKVSKILLQNDICLEKEDQLWIAFLYSNIKQAAAQSDMTKENFDEMYSEIVTESAYCLFKAILQLLQNKLYYNIVKQSITKELNL